uniref:EG45-like domain containing protein n=2 Tax=Rhizophora mucronata TaxID=61149 RepID=A0A2P2ISX3_RHIMU
MSSQRLLQRPPLFAGLFLIQLLFFYTSNGDVGTAAKYSPPYLPTVCYGDDSTKFPQNNLFAAAGDGIWDNGAACGRQYLVRCITSVEGSCMPDKAILVKVVDLALNLSQPSAGGSTIVLSLTAFEAITNSTSGSVNIEFQQL